MKAVEVHGGGQRDIDRAIAYFKKRGIKPVGEFLNAVAEVLERIRLYPERGEPIYGVYRWTTLKGYRYIAYYGRTKDQLITVFAVAHASRRPGY